MIQKQLSLKPYDSCISYSACIKAKYQKREGTFSKLLEIFKKLHTNDPCADDIVKILVVQNL